MLVARADNSLASCLEPEIAAFVRSFSESDLAARQSITQLLTSESKAFCQASIRVLESSPEGPGTWFLVALLLKERLLVRMLTDPDQCPDRVAIQVARSVSRTTQAFELDLEKEFAAIMRAGTAPASRILRMLDLLDAASASRRCLIFQSDLLAHENPAVRAKSALLVARASKTASLAGRLMLDRDPDVQASAVEALWSFDAADAAPMLIAASKSRHPRVAANAIVGLYRIGDLGSIRELWTMARNPDPEFSSAAVWAMGETADPRFAPELAELFARPGPIPRPVIIRALTRIRARQRAIQATGTIEMDIHEAAVDPDGSRRLFFSLWSAEAADLGSTRSIDFSILEAGTPITEYSVTARPTPAVIMAGFVLPRISDASSDLGRSINDAVQACARFKRPDDLWRIDRYTIENRLQPNLREKSPHPYDEAVVTNPQSLQWGFFTQPDLVDKILATPGSRSRAANDVLSAIQRTAEAMTHLSGTRYIYAIIAGDALDSGPAERIAAALAETLGECRISLHVILPEGTGLPSELNALQTVPGFLLNQLPGGAIPKFLERSYRKIINGFDLRYRLPESTPPSDGLLAVHSLQGAGSSPFTFAS